MVLKIQQAGVWNTVADGTLKIKSGGAWQSPSMIYIKSGGVWVDTGYRGAPKAPTALKVKAWDYDSLQVSWTAAPAGGPAIANYRLELRNEANTSTIASENSTDVTGPSWTVVKDTKYQVRLQSVGSNGLVSAWSYLEVGIGHPAVNVMGNVEHTRAWTSTVLSGRRNKDEPIQVAIGGKIYITGMHWRDLSTPQSSVVSGTASRTVNSIINGGDFGSIGAANTGDDRNVPLGNWSTGTNWGLVPRGTGWSTTGNSTNQLHIGSFWMSGTEYYMVNEVVSTTPAKANYYW